MPADLASALKSRNRFVTGIGGAGRVTLQRIILGL
jgi:hypothetical protein